MVVYEDGIGGTTSIEPWPTEESPGLTLVLSGGGFRATLFHLGVLDFLYRNGRIPEIKRIIAVSGGSILAAHLALNFDQYGASSDSYRAMRREIINFCQQDLRNRIFRRILLFDFLIPICRVFKSLSPVAQLQRAYHALFGTKKLRDLSKNVDVYLLSTSLTTGEQCAFTRQSFVIFPSSNGDESQSVRTIAADNLEVAFAVSASSAFPPFFPPAHFKLSDVHALQLEGIVDHRLTDGGVYDNLGSSIFRHLPPGLQTPDHVVFISDAGGVFDWETDLKFRLLPPRSARATDILMQRIANAESEASQSLKARVVYCSIRTKEKHDRLSGVEQNQVRSIRTDLNGFTDYEVAALTSHGAANAKYAWEKVNAKDRTEEAESYHSYSFGSLEYKLRRSSRRSYYLWDKKDWSSWALVAIPGLYCVAVLLACTFLYVTISRHAVASYVSSEAIRGNAANTASNNSDTQITRSVAYYDEDGDLDTMDGFYPLRCEGGPGDQHVHLISVPPRVLAGLRHPYVWVPVVKPYFSFESRSENGPNNEPRDKRGLAWDATQSHKTEMVLEHVCVYKVTNDDSRWKLVYIGEERPSGSRGSSVLFDENTLSPAYAGEVRMFRLQTMNEMGEWLSLQDPDEMRAAAMTRVIGLKTKVPEPLPPGVLAQQPMRLVELAIYETKFDPDRFGPHFVTQIGVIDASVYCGIHGYGRADDR